VVFSLFPRDRISLSPHTQACVIHKDTSGVGGDDNNLETLLEERLAEVRPEPVRKLEPQIGLVRPETVRRPQQARKTLNKPFILAQDVVGIRT
jgi:hypothetical protein